MAAPSETAGNRRAMRAPAVLAWALAALLAAGCGARDDAAAPPGPEARGPLRVRVMTFNLRWDGFDDGANAWSHRRAAAIRVLQDFAPDSVGTQEPMIRQIDDILAAIPALARWRFDNDPEYVRTQQVLYRQDRFERADAGGFLVADGVDGDGTVRYCTWVRLTDRGSGRGYYHYNVHLDHRDAASRRQSVVRLMLHVAAREHADPFVVTGDFNSPERSPEMTWLRGEGTLPDDAGRQVANPLPLVDTFRVLHPDTQEVGTGSGFHGKRRTGAKIDHVLVQGGAATVLEAEIVRTSVDGRFPSDHFPVAAVVEWP